MRAELRRAERGAAHVGRGGVVEWRVRWHELILEKAVVRICLAVMAVPQSPGTSLFDEATCG